MLPNPSYGSQSREGRYSLVPIVYEIDERLATNSPDAGRLYDRRCYAFV